MVTGAGAPIGEMVVRSLLDDPEACRALSTAMARTARPDAADRVVDEVLSVLSLDTRG